MERYIGLDVHAASCTLAVVSEKGRKLRDFPVETNGQSTSSCAWSSDFLRRSRTLASDTLPDLKKSAMLFVCSIVQGR